MMCGATATDELSGKHLISDSILFAQNLNISDAFWPSRPNSSYSAPDLYPSKRDIFKY